MPSKYINKLSKKRVLVLGGTSGIGFCVAENALEHGAIVVVASSRQTSIDKTISRLNESYPELAANVSGQTIDLTSSDLEANIVSLLKFATNGGKDLLDHIVHTANVGVPIQPLSEFKGPESLTTSTQVGAATAILLSKHAPGKYLNMSNLSSITLTGGVNSYSPGGGWSIPAFLGMGTVGLVRALAVDLRPIRVNLVEPGAVDTELFQRTFTGEALEKFRASFRDMTLTGEIGRPEDVAEAYIYLMKDKFVTGQNILTEGGLLLAQGVKRGGKE